ncbi:hypothetical protein HPB50_008471 [Hyalomma asiaticum]|uniref:Uncharacterized protein n=1 Tax=Hyalomma asiaticum TaxID=266040 RepID=A0ACB7RYR5_HYAAI|nr:hypothetical protein HPB50_008471 [Hyalomma asiaticum]
MDESASPEGGLPSKYQKLAYEYSKLRAQAQVLKKAVADEQAKNAELKDALKDKEQGMRKLLQEVESLNFCNQQLTKRVGFLQEELEEDRAKKNKKKHHAAAAAASPMHQGIIDAELQSRIEENEKLHLQAGKRVWVPDVNTRATVLGPAQARTPPGWRLRQVYSSATGCTWYQRRDILQKALPTHLEVLRWLKLQCPRRRLELFDQPKTRDLHHPRKAPPLHRHPLVLLLRLRHESQGSAERSTGRKGSTHERFLSD